MKRSEKILLVLFMLAMLAAAAFSGYQVWNLLQSHTTEQEGFEALEGLVQFHPAADDTPVGGTTNPVNMTQAHGCEMLHSFSGDCVGWLTIPGTSVSYPVMHTPKDPQKYLHRDFFGAYSDSGTPFLDGQCTLDFGNLIIYGHNMIAGTMFGGLKRYRSVDYAQGHQTIVLETQNGTRIFRVFAVAVLDKGNAWYGFLQSNSAEMYNANVNRLLSSAILKIGDAPSAGERLLTLSTCTGVTKSERLVIVAAEGV